MMKAISLRLQPNIPAPAEGNRQASTRGGKRSALSDISNNINPNCLVAINGLEKVDLLDGSAGKRRRSAVSFYKI